jgi:lipopolysaccharide transport system permease protein
MIQVYKEIKENLNALRIQFFVTIKTTVATTRLGALWWIMDPLFLMLIYTFIVRIVFNRGGPKYHLFALCGIVTWQSFARSINLCSTALSRNSNLIKQISLPMHLYVMLPSVVQSFFYLIGLGIVTVWNNSAIGWHTLAIFTLILPMILIPYAIGLFLSIFTVKIPDVGKVVPYLLRLGFYLSPILYPPQRIYELKRLPAIFKSIYALNPMVHVITAVRDLLFNGKMFNLNKMMILMGVTLIFVKVGILFFRTYSKMVPKEL